MITTFLLLNFRVDFLSSETPHHLGSKNTELKAICIWRYLDREDRHKSKQEPCVTEQCVRPMLRWIHGSPLGACGKGLGTFTRLGKANGDS